MKKPIIVVGSLNIDLVATASRIPRRGETFTGSSFNIYTGGKGANQAVAVARLGYPVMMIGCVGDDHFGSQLKDSLRTAGADIDNVQTVRGSSGVALIITETSGENCIVHVPGANQGVTPDMLAGLEQVLKQAGAILTQLEIPYESVAYLCGFARTHNIPLILDPAPARPLHRELLEGVAWLTPNETESKELLTAETAEDEHLADAASTLLDSGAQNVLLKLGSRGCIVAEHGNKQCGVPAFSVTAIDTTAAGDAFNAGFAVALLRGQTAVESARFASAVAAISVTRSGAQQSMPTQLEVVTFLDKAQHTY